MAATSCTRYKICCEKNRLGLEWRIESGIHPAGGLCQDDVTLATLCSIMHSTVYCIGHYVVSSVQNIIHIRSDAET